MPDSIDLRIIGKFAGTNFQAWKFQIRAIFIANKLKSVYGIKKREEAISEVARDEGDDSTARAMVIISATMETSQLEYLLTSETAVKIWNKLRALHEQKNESNKSLLMGRFHQHKMAGDKVVLHVTKVENMTRQTRDVGENLSDVIRGK